MTNEIERRYGSQGLHGLSLNPGGIATGLQVHVSAAVLESWPADEAISLYLKSPAQGAARTVYAAIIKNWEWKGGRYLDNCADVGPMEPKPTSPGYAPHEEKEKKLWLDSLKMVVLEVDE